MFFCTSRVIPLMDFDNSLGGTLEPPQKTPRRLGCTYTVQMELPLFYMAEPHFSTPLWLYNPDVAVCLDVHML